jgi:hypothetical protein
MSVMLQVERFGNCGLINSLIKHLAMKTYGGMEV